MVHEETKIKCEKCYKTFPTSRGLQIHKTRMHPWTPPPPKPEPSEHVNFVDLYSRSWGRNMTHREKKSPSMETLQLTMLMKIVELLHEIKTEIKRPKSIQ